MKIFIFGGTTEGRELAAALAAAGHTVAVSVATPLGAEELRGIPGLTVLVGRRLPGEMACLLAGYDLCVDATHPYAALASAHIRTACESLGLPLRRLARAGGGGEGCVRVGSCAQAAAYLAGQEGNILLTTGSKELAAFGSLAPERLFARVLPTHEGVAACEALGLAHRNILALQGPFTQKMNEAMLEQYHIRWMVTKDGGRAGGFAEKLAAAQAVGVGVVLVERPGDSGTSLEELLRELKGEER